MTKKRSKWRVIQCSSCDGHGWQSVYTSDGSDFVGTKYVCTMMRAAEKVRELGFVDRLERIEGLERRVLSKGAS